MACWKPASPHEHKDASAALSADWTDTETWSRPPRHGTTGCADPEAVLGTPQLATCPAPKARCSSATTYPPPPWPREEHGPPVPELARRMTLSSCHLDPARALVPVLARMPADGIPLGDVLADSGYAHRDAGAWAIPLRQAGAQLIQDLHPHDRGPQGTHAGAIIANGSLYCPHDPRAAAGTRAAAPRRHPEDIAAHDARAAELARHKLGRHHRRRRRRLPPRHLPRRRGQDPLPAPARVDETGPRPARDPHPARAPARLLHPADHHRPTAGRGQDPAETRLPVPRAPPLLRTAHQRRTHLLHHQGPRHHHHRPRLVPPDRPDPTRALAGLPARPSATSASSQPSTPARPTPPAAAAAGLPPKTRKRRRKTLASLAAAPP